MMDDVCMHGVFFFVCVCRDGRSRMRLYFWLVTGGIYGGAQ